ncbi:glycosyltransferase [Shewanella scandinavica]|uniref:glycosyltransferase n=1 Tax=Shewanella scandinavica TaxID=3063538 RepID=UPI00318AFAA7
MSKIILHVLCSGNYSGAEKMALQLIDNYPDEYTGVYFAEHGVIDSVEHISREKLCLVEKVNYRELFKIVKKLKPAVIHAHDFRASIFASMLPTRSKIVSQIHQNPHWFFGFNLLVLSYILSCIRYSKIIFVGNWYTKNKWFNKLFGFKSVTIENCVAADIVEISAKLNVQDIGEVDVLYVGRLSKEKDPIRFINIANQVLEERALTKFLIVGDGDMKNECIDFVNELNIGDSVRFIGFSDNPYAYISCAKLLINTSKFEGFGLVAVESLLLEKPFLSQGVGGLASIFSTNRKGICYSDEEYVKKCIDILSNQTSAQKYLVEKTVIKEKFCNIRLWVNQFLILYR